MDTYKCIIVEGADNTGKNTLCDQIKACVQNETGRLVVNVGLKYEPLVNDYAGFQYKFRIFTEQFVERHPNCTLLLNRSWLDDAVYGPLYRGYSEAEYEWVYNLTENFKNNSLLVMLWDDPNILAAREDGLSLSKGLPEKIDVEQKMFRCICGRIEESGMKTVYVKSSDYSPRTYLDSVKDLLFF